jgi:hypothetical protein
VQDRTADRGRTGGVADWKVRAGAIEPIDRHKTQQSGWEWGGDGMGPSVAGLRRA